jgi:hypothetical protein
VTRIIVAIRPRGPLAQNLFAQDLVAQDLVAQDLVAQDLVAQDLVAQDLVAQDLRPIDLVFRQDPSLAPRRIPPFIPGRQCHHRAHIAQRR